jgi:hypothetical protein
VLLVLDTCNLGVGREPTGGFTIIATEIEGLPGLKLMFPIARDAGEKVLEEARKVMGSSIVTYDQGDMPHGSS